MRHVVGPKNQALSAQSTPGGDLIPGIEEQVTAINPATGLGFCSVNLTQIVLSQNCLGQGRAIVQNTLLVINQKLRLTSWRAYVTMRQC